MKKLVLSLVACFAMVQSTYAATSALTESLLEYDAIISAIGSNPSFENIIPPNEFIIDIKRLTKQIDILGEVKYEILTRSLSDGTEWVFHESSSGHSHKHHKHPRPIKYIATLNVAPNPGIGPFIVTVESIVLVPPHNHHHD